MIAEKTRVKNPNKRLWENYDNFSTARGELVVHVLSRFIDFPNAKILDLGCGTGGISIALAKAGAKVTAVDPDAGKIETLNGAVGELEIDAHFAFAEDLNFKSHSFNAIVLLDVLEHVADPNIVLHKLYSFLKKNGFLYISTPNKFSPLNIAGDPHFSLPCVALLKRAHVKKVVAGMLGWQSGDRRDYPQLFSLGELDALFRANGFTWKFVNRSVVSYALKNPRSIWNRPWHLNIVRKFRRFDIANILSQPMIDYSGFFNKWLNPTWFILSRRVG